MKYGHKTGGLLVLVVLSAITFAQAEHHRLAPGFEPIDIVPGIKLVPNGVVKIGDAISAEIYHYNDQWKCAMQHEFFTPYAPEQPGAATTRTTSQHLVGNFESNAGPFDLTETLSPADAGVDYSAEMTCDTELTTNQLAVAFTLPVAVFGGKPILIDAKPLVLPVELAKKGGSQLFDADHVHEIDLTSAAGTLTITGDLHVNLQDLRQWGNGSHPQYSLRLQFSPCAGKLKESKINFQMNWKAASGQ